ncbi:hypothetical protein ACFOTA_20785 [Chitinophaga sp. GCM10012297]|uniref:Uncharacterized protein n=1 Tax=Chitinophaga chungangae TaxID=2821488 RepID=A0ABS3YIZ4_9BACT|nr:hypothetical protein [Chitinophaga chungangae]MBO9154663.1 hypothetical protein [Chitinophaga chungangae]
MAELRKKLLSLASGRQVRLYGSSIAISKGLEIGEGCAPNIFSFSGTEGPNDPDGKVINVHNLSANDLEEIADYNIQLWMNLKANLRRHGVANPKVFNHDAIR